ncbi:DUF2889 domain-containing protein [Rhodococcus hoagii]|uniref:DUF2889 domain-containing protein n=1 Tax=Rhodococcus hoagii TaxID=43767 RepID=UPI0019F29CC6|nr:DUF2889 domain-containing protein [Rhodococcus sp. GG48]NKS36192.1 DUF2889 domain-containing protein [Prescottella equi]NKS52387.1 DUF2889 domain-containing protein [Prescottella equi]
MTETAPDPALHGAVRAPRADVPVARSNSVRLVTRLDLSRPDGAGGMLRLSGRAWEFEIDARAVESVRDVADLEAVVDYHDGRTLTRIRTSPAVPELATLVGASAIAGFRGRVDAAVADGAADVRAPLAQLLDDVPLGTLISGHAVSAERALDPHAAVGGTGYVPVGDQCAGYVDGGALITTIAVRGHSPVADGPVAPPLDDAFGRIPPALGIHAMRRRRRIDRWTENGELRFDAMFRDTYVRADGVETVIHEYELTAAVDAATGVVREATATPRVLPWLDCPGAVASAGRLVGTAITDVEADVRRGFRGPHTCTHLNDLLRSITR